MINDIKTILFKTLNKTKGGSVLLHSEEPCSVLNDCTPSLKTSKEFSENTMKRKITNANILNDKLIIINSKLKKEI